MTSEPNNAPSLNGAGRIDVARHLIHPRNLRDSLALSRQPYLRSSLVAGFQAGLTVAIALPVVALSPRADLIGFAALGALPALFGRFQPRGGRSLVVVMAVLLQTLVVLGMSMASLYGAPPSLQVLLISLVCGAIYFVTVTGRFGPPGGVLFVFACGAALSPVASGAEVLARVTATGIVGLLAVVICIVTERLRHLPGGAEYPTEQRRPLGHRLIAALRIVVAAAVTLGVAHVLGADHPVWAAMGAMVVLQGPQLHTNMHRALQRMAGGLVGSAFAWLILVQEPSLWATIGTLIALQLATELVIGSNYALGQLFVTPTALLMSYIALPEASGAQMAPERVLDTMLGACVGIVVAVLLSTVDDRHHLVAQSDKGRGA